jgi:hypothetical protein
MHDKAWSREIGLQAKFRAGARPRRRRGSFRLVLHAGQFDPLFLAPDVHLYRPPVYFDPDRQT